MEMQVITPLNLNIDRRLTSHHLARFKQALMLLNTRFYCNIRAECLE